jgi:SAM-dependent methyltransferase
MEGNNFESKLGEKEYWDNFYNEEINQFQNNPELVGEIWFGKQVQKRVVNYISEVKKFNKNIKVLDVGCGNAAFLCKLFKRGYTNLDGMDYSEASIELSKNILKEKLNTNNENDNENDNEANINDVKGINLYVEDISNPNINTDQLYELIHDKGTFDAFLSKKENKADTYLNYIIKKAQNKCIFIITSCNHLKDDLINHFEINCTEELKGKFKLIEELASNKKFQFGGQSGQDVTTLIFQINK